MALTEKSRSALYQGLTRIVDEEAVQEMMSFFPARDVEEPVTKEFLRAEMSDLRAELSEFKAELAAAQVRIIAWNVGTLIAFGALLVAAVRI